LSGNIIVEADMAYIAKRIRSLEDFRGASIVITGCAGFLGRYFMEFFSSIAKDMEIQEVICLDNFLVGKPHWIRYFEDDDTSIFKMYNFDVTNDDLSTIQGTENADFVLHMASVASPTYYRKYPIETLEANVFGLRKLLNYYRDRNIRGFLMFSSSEIYGDPDPSHIPTDEEYRGNVSCIGPRACYDEAKRFSETMCYLYAQKFGMPIMIARPFNNYGPGMKLGDKRVPADFAKAILEGRDIEIFSNGSPTRTFCYIADAIVGYLNVLTYGKYDYFNIGIEEPEISIKRLAEIYVEKGKGIFGYEGKIKFSPPPETDYLTHNPNRRCPIMNKAKELLDYYPSIQVEDGVSRFLKFLQLEGE